MSLPGLTRQSIFLNRLFLDGCADSQVEDALRAFVRARRGTKNADDRRRRLPAQRIRRRPRRRTDADAVEFAGLYAADVGAADEGADASVSRHPLRPARPRQIERAARAL